MYNTVVSPKNNTRRIKVIVNEVRWSGARIIGGLFDTIESALCRCLPVHPHPTDQLPILVGGPLPATTRRVAFANARAGANASGRYFHALLFSTSNLCFDVNKLRCGESVHHFTSASRDLTTVIRAGFAVHEALYSVTNKVFLRMASVNHIHHLYIKKKVHIPGQEQGPVHADVQYAFASSSASISASLQLPTVKSKCIHINKFTKNKIIFLVNRKKNLDTVPCLSLPWLPQKAKPCTVVKTFS